MANKDVLYSWWWSNNEPSIEGPLSVNDLATKFSEARKTNQIPQLKDPLTDSGWNFAILKFLIVYCNPISGNQSAFWSDLLKNKHELGNYGIWKKYLSEKIMINKSDVRFWKIAPGENAKFWERCVKDNNVAVGWDKLGDLTEYINDFSRFREYHLAKYSNDDKRRVIFDINQLWKFVNLNTEDIILANKGKSKIVGFGKVISGYLYRNDYDEYKHTIGVEWFDKELKEIPTDALDISSSWFGITIKELTKDEFDRLTGKKTSSNSPNDKIALLNKKKQIILYGPPGTGKTYNTKKMAIDLINFNNKKTLSIDED